MAEGETETAAYLCAFRCLPHREPWVEHLFVCPFRLKWLSGKGGVSAWKWSLNFKGLVVRVLTWYFSLTPDGRLHFINAGSTTTWHVTPSKSPLRGQSIHRGGGTNGRINSLLTCHLTRASPTDGCTIFGSCGRLGYLCWSTFL